jgi:hypothetical protein
VPVIASLVVGSDGSTSKDGRSAGVSSAADRRAFLARRRSADALLIGGNTARNEPYQKTPVPVVIVSKSMLNPLSNNRLAHWWNCDPVEALARAQRLFGQTVVIESGVSIIEELIKSNGASLVQPRSAGDINDTVEALSFDFIRVPEVERTLNITKPKDENLLNLGETIGRISISKFESKGLARPSTTQNFDYLAMVMIDKNYNGQVFNLCEVVFAEKIEAGDVYFDSKNLGDKQMIIYLDIYGNEFREVVNKVDFKVIK